MSKQNKKMNNLEVNEQTIANSERIMKMLAQRGKNEKCRTGEEIS